MLEVYQQQDQNLIGSYKIGISSTRLILSQGIGTAGATGIVTFFNVEGNLRNIDQMIDLKLVFQQK